MYLAQCTGGCQNGGTCTSPGVCTCTPGWTGANCEAGEIVTEINASLCGFTLIKDINECNGDHVCNHNCNNVNGSYTCSCDPGYVLQSDHRSCKGV